ncbi:ankyrin repeat domain-containing protein 45-like [Actinia tenebrosa]|uniref:Ankyrin repeat domain-containing protein 45-like n=1 Tax=Actinia tenebrosa TaxID=6105 RepID=A0A6P8J2R7_ACTTE|nr:ankyrin repeat domain-containing protein 45-like [Actinia tenebrosa]XP_031573897.1 ankyrin repeat domain-containing protein 45-like [Actinia tenebrosa]
MGKELFDYAIKGDIESIRQLFDDPESIFVTDPATVLNKRDKDGKSPMDMAAMLGRAEVIRELIERGADVNSRTKKGYTALHRAACWNRMDCLRILIANDADLQLRNIHGERARESAARYNNTSCVELLDIAEAQKELKQLITSTKEIIADPEKNMGRFTRDDKQSGNRYCDEKNEWLEANRNSSTLEEVLKQKKEFDELLQPILDKLTGDTENDVSKNGKK